MAGRGVVSVHVGLLNDPDHPPTVVALSQRRLYFAIASMISRSQWRGQISA
jgi:hypothetical protein